MPIPGVITGAVSVIKGIFGIFTGGEPQDFNKLNSSALLPFVLNKSQSTGIPVMFCWFDSIIKVNPDGSWGALALVDGCADAAVWEQREALKGPIFGTRCQGPIDFQKQSEVTAKCSFIFYKGPSFIDTVTGIVTDFVGFDGSDIVPPTTNTTPGQQPDPQTGMTGAGTTVQAGFLTIPSSAGFAIAAVGVLLLVGFFFSDR
jgi:hypothetical protein